MPDRRKFLTWSAGGALVLSHPGQASAQTAATPAPQGSVSQRSNFNSNNHMEPSRVLMNHAFVDNVVMWAELPVKPDRLEAFLDYTVENLKISRSYRGNLAFDILISEAQPNTVNFYEVWESPKAQQEYMAWRTQAGDLTKLLSFLAGEPKFMQLRSIAV